MPTRRKSKTAKKEKKAPENEPKNIEVGTVHEEIEAPCASEVIFRKIWRIRKFHKTIGRRDMIDSPVFRCSVNGMTTFWNIAVRFWKGPEGKKVTNPLVVCLNLTGCETEEIRQARVRFQFGVFDAQIRHFECCEISSVVLNLQNTQDLLSVGYKSLSILDRHIERSKDVRILLKLQLIQTSSEQNTLSQDMSRLLHTSATKDTRIITEDDGDKPLYVHSWLLRVRSDKIASYLHRLPPDDDTSRIKYEIDLSDFKRPLINELIRYIYTDKVDNAETYANRLLPLSKTFHLSGLTALCERTLIEGLTPQNVANVLLVADQSDCECLRKAALKYCEGSEEIREGIKGSFQAGKTLAWRVMKMVNPELFLEACENLGSEEDDLECVGVD